MLWSWRLVLEEDEDVVVVVDKDEVVATFKSSILNFCLNGNLLCPVQKAKKSDFLDLEWPDGTEGLPSCSTHPYSILVQ